MSDSDHALAFETPDGQTGMEIVDRIEQERCLFRTASAVSPEPAATDAFRFPVDRAVRMDVDEVALPNVAGILVRDASGEIVSQVQQLEGDSFPEGQYDLELLTQFKTYVAVEGAVEVTSDATAFRLTFDDATPITVGARSNHERPASTVTTTADPVDMMAAIETFGSALKTTEPDRSFPSLRGHPPSIELGDELDIPEAVERPDTGITLELPARREAVYVAAPLAYYLGAAVEPGPTPKLVTEAGFEHSLAGPEGFETRVEQTLKQVFFLDCVTRTEGLYKIDLHERTELEQIVDLDFEELYDRPLTEQVAAYLDVPYRVVEDHVPDWRLTTHVDPAPETVEQLPFVIDDLAIVRTETTAQSPTASEQPALAGLSRDETFTRSAGDGTDEPQADYVEPQATDSLEQAWIGDDIPIGASKLTREAFDNRLDRDAVEGDISITIVVNDHRMDEERDIVNRVYGNHRNLPFEVNVHREVSTEQLRELVQDDIGFLHYIGHTETDGFECQDGKLDAGTLQETGVQAFLLNACNSYEQGLRLIESGGVGGIVTLNDVINEGAVKMGETIARLLNVGFPLRAALSIARGESILGGQYIVVGDGGMIVTQPASTTPNLLNVSRDGETYNVEFETFATDVAGLGTVFTPNLNDSLEYYISSGKIDTFEFTREELLEYASLEDGPIKIDSQLYWRVSDDLEEII